MIRSVPSSKTSKLMYGGFTGLDTSRSEVVHEVNEHQPFADVDNAYIDWSGYVSNERAIERVGKEGRYISHVRFSYNGEILYATKGEDGLSIWNSKELENGKSESKIIFPTDTITSTLSNGEVVFCAGAEPYRYVAQGWKKITSPDAYGATLCASVSGRLALAGFKDAPTVVRFSRVDDNEIFECDEDVADIQVTKAGGINLKTVLNRAETITALFPFGANQLLIFTNARCLIYEINADLTTWKQVSDVHIYVGCVSQNSICGWANEVIFCSRYGIYTLKRSVANDAEPEVWNKLIQRLDAFLFANKDKVFEEEEAGGEAEEDDEGIEDSFDVSITFGKNKEGKNFLDQLIEDETEDKAFILKRDKESGYIDAFVGLKCVDEKGTVGYKCTHWKPAKYGDLCITGGVAEEEDDEEDDQE